MTVLTLTPVSTVTLDESDGLQNVIATPAPAGDANDNDILTSSLPGTFTARLTAAGAPAPTKAAVSGYNGSGTGTNAFTFSASGAVNGMAFTDAAGAPLDGFNSGLFTADNEAIFLFTDTSNNNVVLGKTSGGAVVFAAYLEETGTPVSGAKIWMVQYEAIKHPDAANADDAVNLLNKVYVSVTQDTEFNLTDAPSGQNLFLMFTTANPTIVDGRIPGLSIIATGKDPANQSGPNPNITSDDINISTGDTINTSKAGGPTTFGTNSQMITEQEGIRFTFVTGARADVTIPELSAGEAHLESNIDFTGMFIGARTADFDVVQLQSGKTAQVRVTAYSTAVESGNSFIDGYAGDATVPITSVRVLDSVTGVALETSSANGGDGGLNSTITVSIVGGVATITGVKAGYSIEYTTSADHNRVLIENAAALNASGNTHADFDIGGFRVLQASAATAEVGSMMNFEDDGPSIVLATPTDTAVVNTQDADTIGGATDSATTNFATAFTASSSSYGADGAGSTGSVFALGVKTQGGDSGLKSDSATIYLYLIGGKVIGSTSGTEAGVLATNTIFDLTVSESGSVTLQQFAEIDHALPGASSNYAAQEASMADDLVTLSATVTLTDQDGDTASDSEVLNIGANIRFDDDGPSIVLATPTDTALLNTQDADTAGFDSASQDFSSAFGTTSSSHGADGAGSTASTFALGLSTPGGASGLTSDGAVIRLYLVGGNVIGSTAATSGAITADNTIFDLVVSGAGSVTLRQFAEIDHALPGVGSNYAAQQATLVDTLITLTNSVTLTDGDGDTATDSEVLNIGANIKFDDHGPTVTAISDLTGANDAQPIAGTYSFSVGADDVDNASTDGIVLDSLTGTTAGGRPITGASVTHFAEDATTVTYNFSFNYFAGPTSTTTQAASGTVVFNKTDGTYTFDLNQIFGGQTTFSTSAPLASFNYDTEGNNSPEIVVQQYSSDFFGVLSARAAKPPSDTSDLVSGGDDAFTAGETFNSESAGFVNVATSTLGVNSDTVQAGELLNFDYYRSNPVSNPTVTSPPPRPDATIVGTDRAYADAINITIDQITDGEDVAVLLKLVSKADSNITTTTLLVANSATDYQSAGGGMKIVSIGTDDYDSATYKIAGVQVISSTEGVTGTGVSLSTHGSVNLTAAGMNYADTADNDVFKIIKIDVITSTTINSDVDLNFAGRLIDGDADYAEFDFDVHLEIDGVANLIGTTNQPEVV
ncbi:hypothetical protein ASC78_10275 [Variovorax sp. Root318D1]|uniref:DUF5801 repeats-in-toxin domain-containing protein n=1 Tax=Variovorax sp. Root318D1 TaxID=1736513 RepID=UPI0006F4D9BC|nr:DUF5801 repeats-in-toxin domain-containing protein [Variovorax sp. Root318D1]KQU84225.1 hypothetical protein ASC78_10275 [Variovorax sp. Root318D1]